MSWFRIKTIDFTGDATVDLLKNYLTPIFIANLANYSPVQLVERYGTHILLGIDIGGRLKYDYKGAVVKESTSDRKLRAIKAGFSIGITKIFSVDFSSDVSKEEKATISNETTDKSFRGFFYGGADGGMTFSGDAAGNISYNFNLAAWQKSINVNNASLININKSVPIYEFITDPVKKQQVKDAVEKYISDRQIKLEYATVQLYRAYNTRNSDRLLLKDPNEVAGLPDWQVEGPFVKVYQNDSKQGTVPLYRFYLNNGLHLHTLNRYEIAPHLGSYEGIIGYVETVQNATNIKIYRYYMKNKIPHMYARDFNELGWGRDGWTYEGDLGYAVSY